METQLNGSSEDGQYSESKRPELESKQSIAFVARGSLRRWARDDRFEPERGEEGRARDGCLSLCKDPTIN